MKHHGYDQAQFSLRLRPLFPDLRGTTEPMSAFAHPVVSLHRINSTAIEG
jgi:hypothetical protein